MYLFRYDENGDYAGVIKPELDPRETALQGKPVYIKYLYTTELCPPTTAENEVAVFNHATGNWTVRKSFKGQYKINTRTGVVSEIDNHDPLKSYELLVSQNTYNDMVANPDKYKVVDGELKDISKTQEYQARKDKEAYEDLIRNITNSYEEFLETPVEYAGKMYLPRYADDYAILLNRGVFPIEIWEFGGLKSSIMSQAELSDLKSFLDDLLNKAYKEKKESIKKYRLAIQQLEG